MFGLTEEELGYICNIVVAPVTAQGGKVYCYGSRARGDYHPFSDLDLMVEAPSDIEPLLSGIREQLSIGNFPYKVDLVQLKDFADSYKSGYERDKTPFPAP